MSVVWKYEIGGENTHLSERVTVRNINHGIRYTNKVFYYSWNKQGGLGVGMEK